VFVLILTITLVRWLPPTNRLELKYFNIINGRYEGFHIAT
jgi:hypothetical protein